MDVVGAALALALLAPSGAKVEIRNRTCWTDTDGADRLP